MKNLILLSFSLLSLNSFASDITRLEGVFTFSDVQVEQVRDVEIVPQQNSQRYTELVEQNYQCYLIADFFKCTKFMKNIELPQSIKTKLMSEAKGKTFKFELSPMTPALINESENLDEWLMFDTVSFGGEQISEYHYYHLKGSDIEVHKAMIGFDSNPQWPVIVDTKTIYTPVQKIITTGRFTSRVFELAFLYKK